MVVGARNLVNARAAVFDRLDEIAADLLRDVDRQVNVALGPLRSAMGRRRGLFAAAPDQQFEVVQRIHEDPSQLQAHRADAERLVQAFVACAIRARRTVGVLQNVEPIPVQRRRWTRLRSAVPGSVELIPLQPVAGG